MGLPLSRTTVLRRLDEAPDRLPSLDHERLRAIAQLLDAGGRARVSDVIASLFPTRSLSTANKALARLVARAREQGGDVRPCISTARSVGSRHRHVWFEPRPGTLFAHLTPELDELDAGIDGAAEKRSFVSVCGLVTCNDVAESSDVVAILPRLRRWVHDSEGATVALLWGDADSGKTVLCQKLVRDIEQACQDAPDLNADAWPQPLYLDLRRVTGLGDGRRAPALEDVLEECMARGWRLGAEVLQPACLLELARTSKMLFVFDGLDEVLVRLTEAEGHRFVQELLRLVSLSPCGNTRVLLTCRTHLFVSPSAQAGLLQGYAGGRLAVMLPSIAQNRWRVPETADLETLNAWVQRRWNRDRARHVLKPDHKERALAALAGRLHARQGRSVDADTLQADFLAWFTSQPDLVLRYRLVPYHQIEHDLLSAACLVRYDHEEGSEFVFAHPRVQALFLARHLVEALRLDDRAPWKQDPPADVVSLVEEHLRHDPEASGRLRRWRHRDLA